ncbi:MAG: hypothetical protein IKM26_06075 [Clostridia bacterium]|nr:hypothetical protein [Clostridia bacterium]
MEKQDILHVSVRRIVEFSLQGGDIAPASLSAMQAGARGHKARQAQINEESERTVRWQGDCEGVAFDISGRIDILHTSHADPLIEEIKLISPSAPLPEAALPVHRMQAVCYAHMLCEECLYPAIRVQITYVTQEGLVRAAFPETLTQDEAKALFFSMLTPFAVWEKQLRTFRALRDTSLQSLPFPFAAYRPGQREMAAQVYTAIRLQKRLFATLPTGTGKSAATLYPALKALGEGKTRQIFYLTARGTARQAATDALALMRAKGLKARSVVLTAKEKICPLEFKRCHPDHCLRAKGHYDRERAAIIALMQESDDWTSERIIKTAQAYSVCPFELSLALCEIADVVICDYNYAFDPAVRLQRIFERGLRVTLLIDEAHNLPSRVRGMLSAALSSQSVALLRREVGKTGSRRDPLYKAFKPLIDLLRSVSQDNFPIEELHACISALLDTLSAHLSNAKNAFLIESFRDLLAFRAALERYGAAPDRYALLLTEAGKEKHVHLLALDIAEHLKACTRRMLGSVFFSATLDPLPAMKQMLGGEEADALFALPSPFPRENLLILQRSVDTRYEKRAASIDEIVRCLAAMFDAKGGNYIAFFPSYAYLALAAEKLAELRADIPLNTQERGMDESTRDQFLDRIRSAQQPLLSLCVLGGVFSEGVDLPGAQLIGAAVIGVGLPQINDEQNRLRRYYDQTLQDGFSSTYRYPGMHKVLQAAGRVIRSEEDKGVILLLDERYREFAYARLLPAHYQYQSVADCHEIHARTKDFWRAHGII